jgi:hypothetical protein
MIVSIHQPNFIPWLGFFDKVDRSDIFILLDNVQFEKNDWQNRNRIKGPNGPQWLTVPVKHRFPQTIEEVSIDNQTNWRRKHWNAIVSNYRKAPFFDQYSPLFEAVYQQEWSRLVDLNMHFLKQMFDIIGLTTSIRLASEFQTDETSSSRLTSLCKVVGGDIYLAGAGGHNYLDPMPFESSRIRIEYQEYRHPEYPQLFGPFVAHVSVLDLIMNCGEQSLNTIRGKIGT